MKMSYDRRSKSSNISPRDWVLVKDESRANTLAPLFLGPWLVVERQGVNVHLINLKTKRKRVVHLNRCKLSPNRESSEEFDERILYDNHVLELIDEDVSEEKTEHLESTAPGLRRSIRIRREPDRYDDMEVYWHNRGN